MFFLILFQTFRQSQVFAVDVFIKDVDVYKRQLLGEGSGQVLITAPNTNVLASKTAIPMIRYEIAPGTSEISTEVFYRTM